MSNVIDFVTRLAESYEPFKDLRDAHLKQNFGELLPYVLFGTYVQWLEEHVLMANCEELARAILVQIDWEFETASEEVRNLVGVQLLEHLSEVTDSGRKVRAMLGPSLRDELSRYRSE